MSARKTIQINPDFFSLNKKKKSKKSKTPKSKPAFKPNNIKKKLLAKIKEHQKAKENQVQKEKQPEILKEDFDDSLKYVQKMIEEKKNKKTMKRRRKNKKKTHQIDTQHNEQPIISNNIQIQQPKDPPYGCLKNGNKPTYSQYKKTLKKNRATFGEPKIKIFTEKDNDININTQNNNVQNNDPQNNNSTNMEIVNPVLDRKMKLEKLKDKFNQNNKRTPRKRLINRNKTIKKYKLGKNIKTNTVGVLIKSGKTRKKIKREHDILKKRCLSDIKYYLRKHNLIKIGTSAPENILREIYENSNLSGEIYNKNVNTLLHNFIKET